MSTVQKSDGSEHQEDTTIYELCAYSYLQFTPQVKFKAKIGSRHIPQLFFMPAGYNFTAPELSRYIERVGSLFVTNSLKPTEFFFYPRLIDQHVEFSIVKEWMTYCLCNHGKLCKITSAVELTYGLKVIDCNGAHLAIVSAPQACSYAALSYVWGHLSAHGVDEPPNETETATCLPEPLPRTIADYIEVCKSLEIRYLWVDRYCIDKSNAEEVHE